MLWCVPGAAGELLSLKPGRHQGWASPSKGFLSPLAHSRLQELSLYLVVLKSDVLIFTPGGFPDGSDGKKKKKKKKIACIAEDPSSIPGTRRSPGERNGYPRQYSCLQKPLDRGAWWAIIHWVPKSWTRLSDEHIHFFW